MDEEKLTRITEALYRVTDLMPEEEPLKWSLRQKALLVTTLFWDQKRETVFKSRISQRDQIALQLKELLQLLELASVTAYISRVNFEVLTREYRLFEKNVISLFGDVPVLGGGDISLKKFIEISEQEEQKNSQTIDNPILNVLEKKNQKDNIIHSKEPPAIEFLKEQRQQAPTEHFQKPSYVSFETREQQIIHHLKRHEWLGRSEIIKVFGSDISEKTVQRDLLYLVEKGVLKKVGEKRWCKYALNKNSRP